jgi:hypothetical protein
MSFTEFLGKMLTSTIYPESVFFLRLIEHLEVGGHTRYIFKLECNRRILFIEIDALRLSSILL